jgi:hypothetical protein
MDGDSESDNTNKTNSLYGSDDEKPASPPPPRYSKWNPWGYLTRTQIFLWVMAALFPYFLRPDSAFFDPPAGVRRYVTVFLALHAYIFTREFSREFFVELGLHWAFIGGIVVYLYTLFGLGVFTRWLASVTVCWLWPDRDGLDLTAGRVLHFVALDVIFEIFAKCWMNALDESEEHSRRRVKAIVDAGQKRNKMLERKQRRKEEARRIEEERLHGPPPPPKVRIGEPTTWRDKKFRGAKAAPPYEFPLGFPSA